jgi:hypothetical protein
VIKETYALAFLLGGLVVAAVGWIWLLARAFRENFGWGLGSLTLPPLALLFALRHAQKAIGPLVVFVVGILAAAAPAFYSVLVQVDLGLHEKLTAGLKLCSLAVGTLQSDDAHGWMESHAYVMQLGGLAAAALAWIWLIFRAFRTRRGWGVGSLVFPPVGLIFTARYPRRGVAPLLLFLLSLLVATVPALFNRLVPLDLGPREKLVDGELHLTLTGWDRRNYAILTRKPDAVVVQMANPDVTDETLRSLQGLKVLRELDLDDTQVTDAGLVLLKDLPALTTLHLARTRITDEGFRAALLSKDSLMRVDLTGTHVSRETAQTWRARKPGRRPML